MQPNRVWLIAAEKGNAPRPGELPHFERVAVSLATKTRFIETGRPRRKSSR